MTAIGMIASLFSVFMTLKINLAISNLQRDIESQRRTDEANMRKWVEDRFQFKFPAQHRH